MNLEILESRTLLAGDMEAQETEVGIEEQACSLRNPKTCSLPEQIKGITTNAIIAPFVLAYDVGANTANLMTGLGELVIDTATCKLSPSEENCTPHRDLDGDLITMVGGRISTLVATYLATKQLQDADSRTATLFITSMFTLGQIAEVYHFQNGDELAVERLDTF